MRYLSAKSLATVMMPVLAAVLSPARAESPRLSTALIQSVLEAAGARADELGVPMGICVVDAGGNLAGFVKMEGAMVHTDKTSCSKAYTSASVRKPSHETGIPPAITAEIASVTDGRFTTLPGGQPLVVKGQVVGAIGVGGGNGEQDIAVATAGAAVAQRQAAPSK